MRVLAVGQRILGARCLRVVASALSVLVLAAVPALGITRLGGDALSSWGTRDGSPDGGLLTWDTPASPVAAPEAKTERASVVELTDWTFTDTRSDVLALIALEQSQVTFDQQLAGAAIFALSAGTVSIDTVNKIFFNELGTQLITDRFSINAADPAQAPLAALLDQEIATDLFLLQHQDIFALPFINQVIFQQLTINSFVQAQFLGAFPAAATPTVPTIPTIPVVTSPAR